MFHDGVVESIHQLVKRLFRRHDWTLTMEERLVEIVNSFGFLNMAADKGLWIA